MLELFKIEGDIIKAISNLLDSINNRINIISIQIDEIKKRRNYILELENIFFNYQISKNDLKPEDLLKLNNNDFSHVMEIMKEEKIAQLTEKFEECKTIIELYKSLIDGVDQIPEATQYEDALNWLQNISDVIMKHLQNYEADSSQNISILENTIIFLKEFISSFKAGELVEPILDTEKLNDILNKSGLELAEKVAIKKAIGIANYNLVINKTLTSDDKNKSIEKYHLIYKNKNDAYKVEIAKILELCALENKELNIENTLNDVSYFAEKLPDYKYKAVRNAVVTILLKKELDSYEENNQETTDNILNNCEKLLAYSREKHPKEEKVVEISIKEDIKEKPKEDLLLIQGNSRVSKAKEIIKSEKPLLDGKLFENKEEYYKLALKDNLENSEETLTLVVESILQSTNLLEEYLKGYQEEPDLYRAKCKELILNITEFIDTYDIIKKRLNPKKEIKTK